MRKRSRRMPNEEVVAVEEGEYKTVLKKLKSTSTHDTSPGPP